MKVVIIGGVAGGASAAARIRRLDEHAQIIMIERSGYVSYANCGLPYYVGGVIKEQEELTLQTPESFWDRFRIDVRVRQEVTAINPAEKTVTVHALDSGKIYTETYDKLLLAPGAKPTVPALSGVSSERVFTLRTVEDTLRIRQFVEDQKPKTAVLAGGGFIGLEMAENLVEMGVSVTIVQRPKQLLAPLDADMASFVHAEMRRHGIVLRLGETVTGFQQDGDSVLTLLEESEPLHSDMVLTSHRCYPGYAFGKRCRTQAWHSWQHRCQRADGNLRAGHLCCGRCRRGHPFRDRAESVDLASGACQQTGTNCR